MEKAERKFLPVALYMTAAITGLLFPAQMIEGWFFLSIPGLLLALITIFFFKRYKPLFGPTLFFLFAYVTKTLPFFTLGLMFAFPIALYLIAVRFLKFLWKNEPTPSLGRSARLTGLQSFSASSSS